MDTRGWFAVLEVVLLVSAAMGVRDAPAIARLRVLAAEEEGQGPKGPKPGERAGSQIPAPPIEDSRSGSSSGHEAHNQMPAVPDSRNVPPPASPSNPSPASRSPLTSNNSPPTAPPSDSSSNRTPKSGSPSYPPPSPVGPLNPLPSSGVPLNPSPSSGSPSHPSPAPTGRSSPPPPSGSHPAPAEARLPNPVSSEAGKETPRIGKDGKEKEKKKMPSSSSGSNDSQEKVQEHDKCSASMPMSCHVHGLIACLQHPQNESQEWFLLVHNEEENPVTVIVSAPASLKIDNSLQIQKHKISKIKFRANAADNLHIVLNAGKGDCNLHMLLPSASALNFFQQFPSYANYVTPVYGAYLVSLTVIFAGGTWACCKFRKRGRRVDAGVPYQQLEMGTQNQSGAQVDDNEMDGWDEDWNDNWDEEAAPGPPEKLGSVSENGVTSKSSDKNDWEDWDD